MLELALKGNRAYWTWLAGLGAVIAAGLAAYLYQYHHGLTVTGLGREVSWGLYISQLNFLVGVAASAVMLVLPYYVHHFKEFGRMVLLGEFLAVSAVMMAMLFVLVDLGKPERLLNMILYASPSSIQVLDFMILTGYLGLNLLIGWTTLGAERKEIAPPTWLKPLIYLSIPWAVAIHTVTAFLYSGLPGRSFWLTAVLAPRFLASAFAAGPAVLILLALLLKHLKLFDAGKMAIDTLAKIVCYAIILHIFLFLLEVFTALYSGIPGHQSHLAYLYLGLEGKNALVPFMWAAFIMGLAAIILLLIPSQRANHSRLALACGLVFCCTWVDKGLGMMSGGFVPNPLHEMVEYVPSAIEVIVTLGVYALGALVLTVFYKLVLGVRKEVGQES